MLQISNCFKIVLKHLSFEISSNRNVGVTSVECSPIVTFIGNLIPAILLSKTC